MSSDIEYAAYYGQWDSGHSGEDWKLTYPKQGELSQDNQQIWDDGEWKTITTPEHHVGNNGVNWYTYNDDTLKIQRIVGLLDKMIMAMEYAIPIAKMDDIQKDLISLKDDMLNYWPSFPIKNRGSVYVGPDEDENEEKDEKIELEEDLFEL